MKYYLFCISLYHILILDENKKMIFDETNLNLNYHYLFNNFSMELGDKILTELEVEQFLLEHL